MNIMRALISVYDKKRIVSFAKELEKLGFTLISTSGTQKTLEFGGVYGVKNVSKITEFPEILEGRIKTTHPKLLGGILAKRDKKGQKQDLKRFGIEPIDLVVCNLYPFEKVIDQGAELNTALEYIDIGGPNMIRAAAKNFENVVVIVNPNRYNQVVREYKENGDVSAETRRVLAVEAFKETQQYDREIYMFLEKIFASKT